MFFFFLKKVQRLGKNGRERLAALFLPLDANIALQHMGDGVHPPPGLKSMRRSSARRGLSAMRWSIRACWTPGLKIISMTLHQFTKLKALDRSRLLIPSPPAYEGPQNR